MQDGNMMYVFPLIFFLYNKMLKKETFNLLYKCELCKLVVWKNKWKSWNNILNKLSCFGK